MYEKLKNFYLKFEDIIDRIIIKTSLKNKEKFNLLRFLREIRIDIKYGKIAEIPHITLSLTCNLRCPYCANGKYYNKSNMGYKEKSIDYWIQRINKMKSKAIIFTGGEPSLFRDYFEVINNIHQKSIIIYSNLSIKNFEKGIRQLKKKCSWLLTYHPGGGADLSLLLKNINLLRKYKQTFRLTAVSVDKYLKMYDSRSRNLLNKYNVKLYFKGFMGEQNVSHRKVECRVKRITYAPDGNRYHCMYGIIMKQPEYIVNHERVESIMICDKYGECAPCNAGGDFKFLD